MARRSNAWRLILSKQRAEFPTLKNPAQPRRKLFKLNDFFDRHEQTGADRELTEPVPCMLGRPT